ncbi:hypothetical protein GTK90_004356 [Salmonella enterica]|nr:hypothetical protein [Salmonella enterica]
MTSGRNAAYEGLIKDQKIPLCLTLAMEAGYQTGEKAITATLSESVLSSNLRG